MSNVSDQGTLSGCNLKRDENSLLSWEVCRIGNHLVASFLITAKDGILSYERLSEIHLPDEIMGKQNCGLILYGKGPVWLYAFLVDQSVNAFPWLAIYDPRFKGGVVIQGRKQDGPTVGDIISVTIPGLDNSHKGVPNQSIEKKNANRTATDSLLFKRIKREDYQLLWFHIPNNDGWLMPSELARLSLPLEIPRNQGIVLTGIGPMWLYGRFVVLAKSTEHPPWIGTFEPRQGRAVIVRTSRPQQYPIGSVIPGQQQEPEWAINPGPVHDLNKEAKHWAIAVVGPPHSGKSVLIAGLQRLLRNVPRSWVIRSTPDGEGLWSQESDPLHAQKIRRKHQWTNELRQWNLANVQLLKRGCDLLLVDTGGKLNSDTADLIKACGRVIILVGRTGEVQKTFSVWRSFCQEADAKIIAELTSDLGASSSMITDNTDPLKAVVAGLDRSNSHPENSVRIILRSLRDRI